MRFLWIVCSLFWVFSNTQAKDLEEVLKMIVKAHGGQAHFLSLRDVQYVRHDYENEIVLFQHVFDGERSQSFSIPLDDSKKESEQNSREYFLFSFPFKLLDQDLSYQLIKKSEEAEDGVRMLLKIAYPNRRVLLFGINESYHIRFMVFQERGPKATEYNRIDFEYEVISGLRIATKRTFYSSSSAGKKHGLAKKKEGLKQVQFWNGFNYSKKKASFVYQTTGEEVFPQVYLSDYIRNLLSPENRPTHKRK